MPRRLRKILRDWGNVPELLPCTPTVCLGMLGVHRPDPITAHPPPNIPHLQGPSGAHGAMEPIYTAAARLWFRWELRVAYKLTDT